MTWHRLAGGKVNVVGSLDRRLMLFLIEVCNVRIRIELVLVWVFNFRLSCHFSEVLINSFPGFPEDLSNSFSSKIRRTAAFFDPLLHSGMGAVHHLLMGLCHKSILFEKLSYVICCSPNTWHLMC